MLIISPKSERAAASRSALFAASLSLLLTVLSISGVVLSGAAIRAHLAFEEVRRLSADYTALTEAITALQQWRGRLVTFGLQQPIPNGDERVAVLKQVLEPTFLDSPQEISTLLRRLEKRQLYKRLPPDSVEIRIQSQLQAIVERYAQRQEAQESKPAAVREQQRIIENHYRVGMDLAELTGLRLEYDQEGTKALRAYSEGSLKGAARLIGVQGSATNNAELEQELVAAGAKLNIPRQGGGSLAARIAEISATSQLIVAAYHESLNAVNTRQEEFKKKQRELDEEILSTRAAASAALSELLDPKLPYRMTRLIGSTVGRVL